MTNPDSILKDRDIILPTKVCIVKTMVFSSSHVWIEGWTIKKAEHQRTDAFKLWCWSRLLRVPWTVRRFNQSILRKSTLNIHWKDWCWSWTSNTLATWGESQLIGKKPWCWGLFLSWRGQEEKGATEDEMVDDITDSTDVSLSKLWEIVKDREAWHAAVRGVTKSQTRLSEWTTAQPLY